MSGDAEQQIAAATAALLPYTAGPWGDLQIDADRAAAIAVRAARAAASAPLVETREAAAGELAVLRQERDAALVDARACHALMVDMRVKYENLRRRVEGLASEWQHGHEERRIAALLLRAVIEDGAE